MPQKSQNLLTGLSTNFPLFLSASTRLAFRRSLPSLSIVFHFSNLASMQDSLARRVYTNCRAFIQRFGGNDWMNGCQPAAASCWRQRVLCRRQMRSTSNNSSFDKASCVCVCVCGISITTNCSSSSSNRRLFSQRTTKGAATRRQNWETEKPLGDIEGIELGCGSWGGSASPLLYQLENLGERCKLPQRGPGQSPGRWKFFLHFRGARWPLL